MLRLFLYNDNAFRTGACALARLLFHARGNLDLCHGNVAFVIQRKQLGRNRRAARIAYAPGLVDADFHTLQSYSTGAYNTGVALYTTVHLHNVPQPREAEYAAWFDGPHRAGVTALPGIVSLDRFEIAREQIMPDIPQPWRYMSVYDFDFADPIIGIPQLGPELAAARKAGLITDDGSERIHTYRLYGDWHISSNWRRSEPLSGVSIIFANYIAGRRQEYMDWYQNVHSIEVSDVPGHVGMKRGELSPVQVDPLHYCPGDQLVLGAQQTDDLMFTIKDFSARAGGRSPSGIAMKPRSSSGSTARTVHYFRKISGSRFWKGGIAYSGDLSVYPGKSNNDRG
jgi:hypothetical protein